MVRTSSLSSYHQHHHYRKPSVIVVDLPAGNAKIVWNMSRVFRVACPPAIILLDYMITAHKCAQVTYMQISDMEKNQMGIRRNNFFSGYQ